jgi:hypothetical protein
MYYDRRVTTGMRQKEKRVILRWHSSILRILKRLRGSLMGFRKLGGSYPRKPCISNRIVPLRVHTLGKSISLIPVDLRGDTLRDRVDSNLLYRRDDAVPFLISPRMADRG